MALLVVNLCTIQFTDNHFSSINNQNYGYFPQIELLVIPCYQYQLVLWIGSNFDSNSSINEIKNDEITDSSSTKYRFRRYPAKNFVISWWWFLTCSQCVTCQSRKCAHQISHLQASNEDELKSSLCQLCKIYVISASKPFQFAGISSSNVSWVVSYIHLDIKAVFCRCYVGLLFIASRGNAWGWFWWISAELNRALIKALVSGSTSWSHCLNAYSFNAF